VALMLALGSTAALSALAAAVTLLSTTETAIAARHRDSVALFYEADATLARAIVTLRREPDWSAVEPPLDGRWRLADAGGGMVTVTAVARGRAGARRTVEAILARSGGGVRLVRWREVR
jgi:hypothetical protein